MLEPARRYGVFISWEVFVSNKNTLILGVKENIAIENRNSSIKNPDL